MEARSLLMTGCLAAAIASLAGASLAGQSADTRVLERGRYLVSISGCNDCHTPRYSETAGAVPLADWLTGSAVGFRGPWGTTYPSNLRLSLQAATEEQWLRQARGAMRPPMPWFALRDMSDADLRAIYHFIRSLGPKGDPAPAYAPPGQQVSTPYFDFVPKNLPQVQAAR